MVDKLFSEETILLTLLDFLINNKINNNSILAREVPYLLGKRKVDLLSISEHYLHAYEIKSDADDLRTLESQIRDYINTFDFTSVITSGKYATKILSLIPPSVGILIINNNSLNIIREAKRRFKLRKSNRASLFWKEDIRQALVKYNIIYNSNFNTENLRYILIKNLNLNQLNHLSCGYLYSRYSNRYNNFIKEKQDYSILDDLKNLTLDNKKIRRR